MVVPRRSVVDKMVLFVSHFGSREVDLFVVNRHQAGKKKDQLYSLGQINKGPKNISSFFRKNLCNDLDYVDDVKDRIENNYQKKSDATATTLT